MNKPVEWRTLLEAGETADAVIAYARRQRHVVSRSQLERRHRANILHRPVQLVRRDSPGTVTLYPAGTKELLVTALSLELRYRSLDRVRWEMWMDGHAVPLVGIRGDLARVARFHDRIARLLRRLGFGRAALSTRALRLIERVTPRYGGAALPPVRSRLEGEQQVQTFVRIMADVATGSYAPLPRNRIQGPSDDEGLLIEKAFGLDEARSDVLPGRGILQGDTGEELAKGARLVGGNWSDLLHSATDAELIRARDRWVRFQRKFPVVVEEAREIFGGSAFGLRAIARLVAYEDEITSAAAVLIMLRLGRSSDRSLQDGWDNLILVSEKWITECSPWLPAFRVLRLMPELRDPLSPVSLRRSVGGPQAQERLRVQLLQVATAHMSEIAAALARAQVILPALPPVWSEVTSQRANGVGNSPG